MNAARTTCRASTQLSQHSCWLASLLVRRTTRKPWLAASRRSSDGFLALSTSPSIRATFEGLDGPFRPLRDDPSQKDAFYHSINELYSSLRFRLFAVAIDKRRLSERFIAPLNPYDVSLSQLLSMVCGPPGMSSINRPNVARIVAESRGKREDKDLQREYQSFRRGGLWSYGAPEIQRRRPTTVQRVFPDRVDFARKNDFVAGLELADLAAYPIARAVVNQSWDNPAVQVLTRNLRFVQFP
jgi:hypothetical protein